MLGGPAHDSDPLKIFQLYYSYSCCFFVFFHVGTIGFILTGVAGMVILAIIIVTVTLYALRIRKLNRNSQLQVFRMAPVTVATVQQELQPARVDNK